MSRTAPLSPIRLAPTDPAPTDVATASRRSRWPSLAALAAAGALIAGCTAPADPIPEAGPDEAELRAVADGVEFVVHRTETCGCCGEYEDHLAGYGFEIHQEMYDDLGPMRRHAGVPDSEASCHTGEVAGYAVEGHVPMEAIHKLLEDRPDVDGIALAGMPAGSPGMPGEQEEEFVVTFVDDGEVVGELGRF